MLIVLICRLWVEACGVYVGGFKAILEGFSDSQCGQLDVWMDVFTNGWTMDKAQLTV